MVSNVGLYAGVGPDAMTVQAWTRSWAVNPICVILMRKHAVPVRARRGGGSTVNISSIAVIRALARHTGI
jgi:NAD(P)-dependent dehydrogenase (short-subunit alcohol dehydrogenase family)